MKQKFSPLTYVRVDLKAIEHNFIQLKKLAARNKFTLPYRDRHHPSQVSSSQILAVVKADAYGHGVREVSLLLDKLGVGFFGVSEVWEGVHLRRLGIKKPVLLFESTLPQYCEYIVDYNLTATVCTFQLAARLNEWAKRRKKKVNIHIKVDTGMGRLGIWHEEAFDFIKQIYKLPYLTVEGIYTHFPSADTDKAFTKRQLDFLYELICRLDLAGMVIPCIHASNSMGLAGYRTVMLNLFRPGLMLYGLYPSDEARPKIKLKPALSVRSKITFLKTIEAGRSISYGRTFIARRKMKVATIPIGYNDGYLRALSNKASVLIHGAHCRVLGRVTMDQIIVDVTRLTDVAPGTPVTIIGRDRNQEITADDLAEHAQTINYEIACCLGNRLPRVYHATTHP